MIFGEPFLPRHPWLAALLLGTLATPAAVIFGALAPRPLDAVLALPLVLLDIWVAALPPPGTPEEDGGRTLVRLFALLGGIGLTWLLYVLLARLLVWRLALKEDGGSAS